MLLAGGPVCEEVIGVEWAARLAGDSAVMPASPLSPPSPATLGITAGPAAAAPVPNMLAGRASGTIQYVLASSKHNKLAQ